MDVGHQAKNKDGISYGSASLCRGAAMPPIHNDFDLIPNTNPDPNLNPDPNFNPDPNPKPNANPSSNPNPNHGPNPNL